MAAINAVITGAFDLALARGDPWFGLVVVSLATGFVLLLVFRYTSNQRAIRATKDRIVAHLLEVVLYRDQMPVVVRAQARLFVDNLRYLGYALVPLAFMLVPVVLMLVQLDLRYGRRPLQVGETSIIAVHLDSGTDLDRVSITAPRGLVVETRALRIPALEEVDWRIRAAEIGRREVRISVNGVELAKQIVVGERASRVSPARVSGNALAQLLHPGEPPIPAGAPVESVTVSYPTADLKLLGRPVHWIWPWLIISMAFGYALKGPLKVQV